MKKPAKKRGPFAIGTHVVSDFIRGEEQVVRRITACGPDQNCGSGWRASADGGEPCPTCGCCPGKPIGYFDSAWFTRARVAELEGKP